VTEALRAHFRPEFLNRLDEIIVFHPLGREHMLRIVDIQLGALLKRLEDRKIDVELTDAARAWSSRRATTRCTAPAAQAHAPARVLDPLAMRCSTASSGRATAWCIDAGDVSGPAAS
jgi:ATP-dependent Clp protease ATP-binding subunit ClpB